MIQLLSFFSVLYRFLCILYMYISSCCCHSGQVVCVLVVNLLDGGVLCLSCPSNIGQIGWRNWGGEKRFPGQSGHAEISECDHQRKGTGRREKGREGGRRGPIICDSVGLLQAALFSSASCRPRMRRDTNDLTEQRLSGRDGAPRTSKSRSSVSSAQPLDLNGR